MTCFILSWIKDKVLNVKGDRTSILSIIIEAITFNYDSLYMIYIYIVQNKDKMADIQTFTA